MSVEKIHFLWGEFVQAFYPNTCQIMSLGSPKNNVLELK